MIAAALMMRFTAARPGAEFVQIGASDGVSFDPLRPHIQRGGWSGVLVEPLPYMFERLREAYEGNERIRLFQVAVAAEAGRRTIHYVDPERIADGSVSGIAPWAEQVASFDRAHVLANLGPADDPDSLIAEVEVECVTLAELLAEAGIVSPDLIMVDAEGADAEIVRSIDFGRCRPRLIVFEHEHLDASEQAACEELLRDQGYELVADGLDTWALDTIPDDDLSRGWLEEIERRRAP